MSSAVEATVITDKIRRGILHDTSVAGSEVIQALFFSCTCVLCEGAKPERQRAESTQIAAICRLCAVWSGSCGRLIPRGDKQEDLVLFILTLKCSLRLTRLILHLTQSKYRIA